MCLAGIKKCDQLIDFSAGQRLIYHIIHIIKADSLLSVKQILMNRPAFHRLDQICQKTGNGFSTKADVPPPHFGVRKTKMSLNANSD